MKKPVKRPVPPKGQVPTTPSDPAEWSNAGGPGYADGTLIVPGYDAIDLNDGTEF